MSRSLQGKLLVVAWVVSIAVLVLAYVTTYHGNGLKFSFATAFPRMPFYGAVTWWFFFTIPIIGWTWGYFNDLKRDD